MNEQFEYENTGTIPEEVQAEYVEETAESAETQSDTPAQPFSEQYRASREEQQAKDGPPRYNPEGYPAAPPYMYTPPHAGYQDRPRQNGGTYQYSASSGWQTPQQEGYQWNFADYDQFDSKKSGKRRNRGIVVFAVSLLCVLSVALVGLSGYSIWRSLTDEVDRSDYFKPDGESEASLPAQEPGAEIPAVPLNPGAGDLELNGKPKTGEAVSADGKLTIPQVARQVGPSVVGVIQYMNTQFFEPSGVGSGIIMSEDGYIITNAHVVRGADAIKVVLDSGEPYEAIVIGSDRRSDLAVLKIDVTDLQAAQFGNSDDLEVGETVIAIGNPTGMDLAGSVTLGIVSAVNREVRTPDYTMNFIQTDAAINPGNSGGALVNEYGQVVGINSAKISEEGYEGIGFAIPITEAKPIIDDLIRNGRVTGRVVLGITARAIDEATARTYDVPMGLQIIEIQNEDLIKKGVQVRDIITEIDGERIYTSEDVRDALNGHKAGDTISIKVFRQTRLTQNTTFTVDIVLMEDMG